MGQRSRTVKVPKQSTTASEPPKMLFAISRFGQGYPVGPDHPQAMSAEECSKKTGQGVDELQDLWRETFGKHIYPEWYNGEESRGGVTWNAPAEVATLPASAIPISPWGTLARELRLSADEEKVLNAYGHLLQCCELVRLLPDDFKANGDSRNAIIDNLESDGFCALRSEVTRFAEGRLLEPDEGKVERVAPARPTSSAILDLICRNKRERAVALSWAHLLAANERSDVFLLETDEASAISTQVEEMLNRALLEFVDGAGPVAEADAGEADAVTADASPQGIESMLAQVLTPAEMAKLLELVGKYVEVVKAARTLYTASAVDPEEDVKPLDDHARRYVDQPANAINQLLANVRILPEAESGGEEDEGAEVGGEAIAAGA